MSYTFNILVIDDQIQIHGIFETYKKYLKKKYDLDVEFTIVNNEDEYDEEEPYDILMVDYNLRHGFYNSDKQLGNEFIEEFRQKNNVSKVIFYSSEFEYDPLKRKYKFPFANKDLFDLINILGVDKVTAKNNFEMTIQVIKEACEQMDILPLILSRTLAEYKKNNIEVSYTNINGEDINVSTLFKDLLNDNEQGKQFRKEIIETVLSVLFKYKY
ncbi:hypothetical protein [Paenibacillus segetis]|uniref:Response regulator receiver domain-containing protein n=1 Tax=Paenibacillus segetis TaxID=1325360 RepID=A0ABQ1Y408_9BACL|nr:hypothetical protein [Paenibacillus segetis]GGH11319.1 hypothetical protein GCM10008013_03040 [Paenibacillus segetis]